MNKQYTFTFLFLFSCVSWTALAQSGALKGRLQDKAGTSVPYANVALLLVSDTSLNGGAVTNAAGEFTISTPPEGTYVLRLSSIGFIEKKTAPFSVTDPSFSKDFGVIAMEEEVKSLEEVTVQAMRPIITQEADRMVVSIEGTALAAGSTALDVLAKSPGVFIDQEGNIQLNGRAGVTIMLDGRLTYLSAKDLQTMLEGMSAENIKNIEIITNPSAKYDAEGSSGILNINLIKNEHRGMSGSLHGSYAYNSRHSYSAGGNFDYKSGKLDLFLNLDIASRPWRREAIYTRVFKGEQESTYFDQQVWEDKIKKIPSFRLGGDYEINKQHSVGFMANVMAQKDSTGFHTETFIGAAPNHPALHIDASNIRRSRFSSYATNLHYNGKLDTLGTTLSADLDYVKIRSRINSNFNNYFDELATSEPVYSDFLLSKNPSGYDIYAAKVDFAHPFRKVHRIEAGAKASRVISDNDLRFYFNNGETPTLDSARSNHFIYEEKIYAAYLNLNSKLSERITVQAGLRAENTRSRGELKTTGEITERNYFNLFPSLFIQQKVNEDYQIAYNYSRRIQRPDYEQLNPFIFFLDPFTWAQGNPHLRPEYTHAIGLSQTFKKAYNLVLGYQITSDFIAQTPLQDIETRTTTFVDRNVDDAQYLSATAIVPVKLLKNWDTNNTLVVAYQEYSTIIEHKQIIKDQVYYSLQSNHNIQLPLGFRGEINAGYRGPSVWGLYRFEKQWWVNLGLKKSFLEEKVDLSINANDIFRSRISVNNVNIGENINQFNQYFFSRSIGLTLRYRFSKGAQFDGQRRNNELEEVNRAR